MKKEGFNKILDDAVNGYARGYRKGVREAIRVVASFFGHNNIIRHESMISGLSKLLRNPPPKPFSNKPKPTTKKKKK